MLRGRETIEERRAKRRLSRAGKMLDWELILVTVLDKQMAMQLNKLSAYVPNLKFVVREDEILFTLLRGDKKRRVWKER